MNTAQRVAIGVAIITAVSSISSTSNPVSEWIFPTKSPAISDVEGAVMKDDIDPEKRYPLNGVQVIDSDTPGLALGPVTTQEDGSFKLKLRPDARSGQSIDLQFTAAGYQKKTANAAVGVDVNYTFYLWPSLPTVSLSSNQRRSVTATVVRVADTFAENQSKTFQIPNYGSVRCNGGGPCSPDGKWKASVVTSTLDAGLGNKFISCKVVCVAGPCPWTKVNSHQWREIALSVQLSSTGLIRRPTRSRES